MPTKENIERNKGTSQQRPGSQGSSISRNDSANRGEYIAEKAVSNPVPGKSGKGGKGN